MHPFPAHSRLVFKGIIFDVYQWDQVMFDGSIQVFEGLTRPDSCMVIPTMNGKVLLSHESQPEREKSFLSLFGGRREGEEDILLGAKRELLEEAGLVSDDWELFASIPFTGKVRSTTHIFIARDCRKVKEPSSDPGERIEVLECSFDDFLDVVCFDDFRVVDLSLRVLRMRFDPAALDDFRRKLFPHESL